MQRTPGADKRPPDSEIGHRSSSNATVPVKEPENLWEGYTPNDRNPRTRWWTENYPLSLRDTEQLQSGVETRETSNEHLDGQEKDWTSIPISNPNSQKKGISR